MSPEIQRAFDKLEHQKESLLLELSVWSPEQLSFRPDSNSWSALDVVDHLHRVEKGILAAMRSNLPHGQAVALKDRLGALTVRLVMRSPWRVKVPAATPSMLPGPVTGLATLSERWSATRVHMAKLLDSITPCNPRIGYFRHPRSGWLNVLQTIKFLSVHLRHHFYQVQRLDRAARSLHSPA